MKTCTRVALPELLLGILLLQSAGAQLNRERHLTDLSAMTSRVRTDVNNDEEHENKEQIQVLEEHLLRRTGYEKNQEQLWADTQRLPPRHPKHLEDPSGESEEIRTMFDYPCPSAAAIAPCVCDYDADYNIDLDCTEVESEEQLANVFLQEFPVKELVDFKMTSNSAIKTLGNILNGISFQRINLYPGDFVLEEISEDFLLGIKDSLTFLAIDNSQLTSEHFPFSILADMENLDRILMDGSSITWIPTFFAPKLSVLRIDNAKTEIIESGTFPIGEGMLELRLRYNNIATVEPGSFYFADENSRTSNEEIYIDISGTNLEILEPETFVFRDGPMVVWLADNMLYSIAPGTFVMPSSTEYFQLQLSLTNNNLETFDEDVFAELMPYVRVVYLHDNPLLCGCDLAWLMTNPAFEIEVDDRARCANGTYLHELDPAIFEDMC